MKYCTKCGAKLIEGAKFCTVCGNRVDQNAPEQNVLKTRSRQLKRYLYSSLRKRSQDGEY